MLGLPKGEVFLVPWTQDWQIDFEKEKKQMQEALKPLEVKIHQIGSTAVENLSAKPIIDIAIELEDFEEGLKCIEPLEKIGYSYGGTNILPERYYFIKGEPRTHQIHMYEKDNKYLLEQLNFRDYLIENEQMKTEYEKIKQNLAKANIEDKHQYAEDKTAFIQAVLKSDEN